MFYASRLGKKTEQKQLFDASNQYLLRNLTVLYFNQKTSYWNPLFELTNTGKIESKFTHMSCRWNWNKLTPTKAGTEEMRYRAYSSGSRDESHGNQSNKRWHQRKQSKTTRQFRWRISCVSGFCSSSGGKGEEISSLVEWLVKKKKTNDNSERWNETLVL